MWWINKVQPVSLLETFQALPVALELFQAQSEIFINTAECVHHFYFIKLLQFFSPTSSNKF